MNRRHFIKVGALWTISRRRQNLVGLPPSAGLDAAVTAWAAQVVTNGGAAPTTATKNALNDFVNGCKSDGVWSDLIIFNGIVPDSKIAMNTPLIAGPGLSLYTLDTAGDVLNTNGYVNNGNHATTGVAASAIWSSNTNAGFFVYLSRDRTGGTNIANVFNGVVGSNCDPCFMVGNGYMAMFYRNVFPTLPALGYYYAMRNSTTNQQLFFANSGNAHASIFSDTGSHTDALPPTNVEIMRSFCGGGGDGTFQGGISAIGFCNAISSAKSALLFNRLQTYRTALGGGYI